MFRNILEYSRMGWNFYEHSLFIKNFKILQRKFQNILEKSKLFYDLQRIEEIKEF